MPFALMNAPASFQRYMDSVFSDLTGKYLHVYIDDLLIYSQTFEEHLRHFEIILKRLSDAGLKASLEKTLWFVSSLPYLGYILHQGHVSMDPEKVKDALAIQTPDKTIGNTPSSTRPKTLRKLVRIFLGLTGFYRQFIKDYALIARPLFDLTKT